MLEAARDLFECQGYQATTTAQIVERASVDQPTLYRHFSSKAELFEATVLTPLRDFLEQHFEFWRSNPPGQRDPEQLARHFVVGLYDAVEPHRDSLRLLLTATAADGRLGDLARSISEQFTQGMVTLRQALLDEARAQGYAGLHQPDATIGAITGMVLAMALFDEWVFPGGRSPDRRVQTEEAAALMLHGVAHRP
ncbi:AcrR family transcriptional regulator [Pseudonocardia eucalypti]|uniref:TetR family transcriptional regulator n=1 Tax=Pseudonocardia eucalypti TaxID=648755 RepID=UPI0016184F84|nr:AcrR family transcriptional regulator [Pseudonocardia eucalypti]